MKKYQRLTAILLAIVMLFTASITVQAETNTVKCYKSTISYNDTLRYFWPYTAEATATYDGAEYRIEFTDYNGTQHELIIAFESRTPGGNTMAKYAYYDGEAIGFLRLSKSTDNYGNFTISLSTDNWVDFEHLELDGKFVLQQEEKPVEYWSVVNYSTEPRYIWMKTAYATATYDGEEYTLRFTDYTGKQNELVFALYNGRTPGGDPVAEYAYYNGEPVIFGRFEFSKDSAGNFKVDLYTKYVSDTHYLELDGNFYTNENRDLF